MARFLGFGKKNRSTDQIFVDKAAKSNFKTIFTNRTEGPDGSEASPYAVAAEKARTREPYCLL